MARPSKEQREVFAESISQAFAGRLVWLDRIIRAEGYYNSDGLKAKQIGAIWGVSVQAVGQWHTRDGCPRNADGSYSLKSVARWREERLKEAVDESGLGANVSPAQERYRDAAADLKEIERDKLLGLMIPRRLVHDGFARIASVLRSAGLILEKRFGKEALEVLNEALEEAETEIVREFGGQNGRTN